jgi:uncharacterized phage-associated protein
MATSITFEQDVDKLIEAAIYLCELSADDPEFTLTKLVKLLYFADCDSFLRSGKPITGTTYLHFPHGPHPENWYRVREQMEVNGDVAILFEPNVAGCHQYRILPKRNANLERLSREDVEMLEAEVQRFADFNAAGLEHYSHQEFGWLSTEDGQPIPYALAGVISPRPSAKEIQAGPPIIR